MRIDAPSANPFVLMLAPQQVLQAMEKSDALRRLQHRVVHPLDSRTVLQGNAELAAFDAAIESANLAMPPEEDDTPPV